ncbi:hypothetical protein ACG2K1_07955 [Neisseria sp. 23W00296]|uniref:hypothetical protein n=1 Tax=unclassified Neisseria TaxID=2623750 RepID=UPI0012FE760C|nr:hypothetical protein [Neisseria sp. KEM232]
MLTFSLRSGFLRKNSRLQGKKRSKIEYLASIFDAAGVDFYQKYRRKADCQRAPGAVGNWYCQQPLIVYGIMPRF